MTAQPKPVITELVAKPTTDYDQFKTLEGNRDINKLHLSRLMASFERTPLITVIIVNEKREVIDGRHRLQVAKSLGLPIWYIVIPGYGLEEVHILNANQKNWSADDYLKGYCDMGLEHYVVYRDFKDEFGFDHNTTRTLLTGTAVSGRCTEFYEGRFEVADLDRAYKWAEQIRNVAPYYNGWKRRSFIHAMVSLFKRPQFDYSRFVMKIKSQPTRLIDCADTSRYVELIEEVYNYRCSEKNKINLRF